MQFDDADDDDLVIPPYRPPPFVSKYFVDYSGKIGKPIVVAFSAERGVKRANAVTSHLWNSCQIGDHDLF